MEIRELLDRFDLVEPQEDGSYMVRCPAHDDGRPSLHITDKGDSILLYCFAGCSIDSILTALGLEACDLYIDEGKTPHSTVTGITVAQLAGAKGFSLYDLEEYGFADTTYQGSPAIRISYLDERGKEAFYRFRIALEGDRFRNLPGTSVCAYGQQWLPAARESHELVLVEGETDAVTCFIHRIPCIGLPGASTGRCLSNLDLQGIETIYAVKEPDSGGSQFAASVDQALSDSGWNGNLRIISLSGASDLNELYLQNPDEFESALDACKEASRSCSDRLQLLIPGAITGADLLDQEFPEPDWVIPEILPEGLALLAGKPKVGKSFLCMNLAVAVSLGDPFLGDIAVEPGRVVYLALEDNHVRLRDRLAKILNGRHPPENLYLVTDCPRLDKGGHERIENVLKSKPPVRILIIDTLGKIRHSKQTTRSVYDLDYRNLEGLQGLAMEYGVCILLVHHLRKQTSDDPLELVSGSTAITGCSDTAMILRRSNASLDATLHVTGRDVIQRDLALRFDAQTCTWINAGTPEFAGLSPERQRIIQLFKHENRVMGPTEIAELLAMDPANTKSLMSKMVNSGQLNRPEHGKYEISSLMN